jgi:hypothetical protein
MPACRRAVSGPCCPDGNRFRLFESLPLVCPNCGADRRIIAVITEAALVEQILTHLGEPPRPPPISPARPCAAPWVESGLLRLGTSPNHPGSVVRCFSAAHPPAWDEAPEPMPDWDLLKQPEPDFELDQRVSW